ncbi:hypothetical protein LINPERPRIM_LOCUS13488 [Linum perenne]
MASSTNEVKVTLKLFIDKKTNKVVFAESGKEFVDFLFSFLSLPLGTLIRLLSKDQMLGCMGNLYQSVEDLDVTFMQPSTSKNSYLKPTLQQLCTTKSNLLSVHGLSGTPTARKFYKCSNCKIYVTDTLHQTCPRCGSYHSMGTEVVFTGTDAVKNINEGGFVKGGVNYLVMDDLEVIPLSSISVVTSLKNLNIQQIGSLEEKVVEIGMDESKTVLTTVFLGA